MRLKLYRLPFFQPLPSRTGARNSKGERITVLMWLWWLLRINRGRDRRYDFR